MKGKQLIINYPEVNEHRSSMHMLKSE